MLLNINIQNIALIRELSVDFKEGFNVLSGETGAGKSIIVDSVSLILGARADKELIKHGEEKAYVEALVSVPGSESLFGVLKEYGIDVEGELIVSRELSLSGKNVCRINGRMVPLNVLKEVMGLLINLHGQDAQREVMVTKNHLAMLDKFVGEPAVKKLQEVSTAYMEYSEVNKELSSLKNAGQDRLRNMDMYSYQIEEIKRAALKVGEEDELIEKRSVMQNAEKLLTSLYNAKSALNGSGGTLESLHYAISELKKVSRIDSSVEEALNAAQEAYYTLSDTADTVSQKAENMTFEPGELEKAEERIELIRSVKRKYGADESSVLEYLEKIEEEYDRLKNMDIRTEQLERELKQKESALLKECSALTDLRKKAALELEKKIDKELKELGMIAASFKVGFIEKAPAKNGADDVQFYVSLNEGEPLKPLEKVASGGEASRIMLAFKTIMASKEDVETLIFDEIDTGISGKMAKVVARKLSDIARQRQVICVSHLPQIAAMADENFLIEKSTDELGTKTELKELDIDSKRAEVARLSGGTISDTAIAYASELIEECNEYKRVR